MVEHLDGSVIDGEAVRIFGDRVEADNQETENIFGRPLPMSFTASLKIIQYVSRRNLRQEIFLPEDPVTEASYWLGFYPKDSFLLEDSLLVRITGRPQSLLGILDNPHINEISAGFRKVYNGREIGGREVVLPYIGKPVLLAHGDVAKEFEDVIRKYSAVDDLLERGYKHIKDRAVDEYLTVYNLS